MTLAVNSVRRMSEIMHPCASKEQLTVVLQAYLDDSGTNGDDKVVVVAGFVGSTTQWAAFEKRWKKFLNDYSLTVFHAAPFLARKRPYDDLSDEKYENAKKDICAIFSAINPFGIGNAVNIEAFREWRSNIDVFVDPDPYYFCLNLCLRTLIRGISQAPHDEGVAIYIDRDPGRQRLGEQTAKWHEDRLRRNPPVNVNEQRSVTTAYGSMKDYLPLQAADILAHGTLQGMRGRLETDMSHPDSFFIECMKRANVPVAVNHFFDQQMFDNEHKKMTSLKIEK